MEQNEKAALINRLKSVAGHVNGIVTMVEEDRYCVDLIKQIQAAQAALAKANQIILDNHLRTCLTTASGSSTQAAPSSAGRVGHEKRDNRADLHLHSGVQIIDRASRPV